VDCGIRWWWYVLLEAGRLSCAGMLWADAELSLRTTWAVDSVVPVCWWWLGAADAETLASVGDIVRGLCPWERYGWRGGTGSSPSAIRTNDAALGNMVDVLSGAKTWLLLSLTVPGLVVWEGGGAWYVAYPWAMLVP
jgi:hypothetical protein